MQAHLMQLNMKWIAVSNPGQALYQWSVCICSCQRNPVVSPRNFFSIFSHLQTTSYWAIFIGNSWAVDRRCFLLNPLFTQKEKLNLKTYSSTLLDIYIYIYIYIYIQNLSREKTKKHLKTRKCNKPKIYT